MPTYKYEAMDTSGTEVKDSVDATSEEEAQQKIRQMGYFVTKITEVAGKKDGKKGGKKFYYGRGCDRCNNTGHRGRMGVYELVVVDDDIRDLISKGVSTDQLRAACRQKGMVTLRESGLRALFRGQTTLEEVVRETVLEEEV